MTFTASNLKQCPTCGQHHASKVCPRCSERQPKPAKKTPEHAPERLAAKLSTIQTPQTPPEKKTAIHATGEGAKPRRGKQMNQTEARFLRKLQCGSALAAHSIQFEAVKLRIGENCYYCPDFMALNAGAKVTFYEVKGAHIWDDSKVKFKAAKERYPHWSFECWQWKKGEWRQLL